MKNQFGLHHKQNHSSGRFVFGIIAACAIFLALPTTGMAGELPPYTTSVDLATYTFDALNGNPTGVSSNINAGTFDLRDWTTQDGYSSVTHSIYVKASADTPTAIDPTGNAYHSVTFTVQGLDTNETLSLTSLRFGSYGTYREVATTFIQALYSSLTGADSTNSELARVSFTSPVSVTTAYTPEITTVADLTAANPAAGSAFTGLTNGASVTFRFYYADDSNEPSRDVHRLDNIVLSGILNSGTVITSVVATASSERDATYPASNTIDGVISDASRWMNVLTDNPAWLRLDFPSNRVVRGITLYSGYGDAGSAVQGFVVEYVKNGNWAEIPGSLVSNNVSQVLDVLFDEDVTTPAIRIVFSDVGYVRVREVEVWGAPPAPFVTNSFPGIVQFEDFDTGGKGVAYYDTTVANQGNSSYRSGEGVDVGNITGGREVNFTSAGEWMKYTIASIPEGMDTLDVRVASPYSDKKISMYVDGAHIGTITVPNTGNWGVYTNVVLGGLSIPSGSNKVVRIVLDDGYYNLDYFSVSGSTASAGATFASWASGFGAIGSETNDYDGDTVNNLLEYALNGNPTNSGDVGIMPAFVQTAGGFEYIHVFRNDDTGLVYTVETTTDLVSGTWTNMGYTVTGTNVTGGAYDEVTNSIPVDAAQSFVRLKVENQ